MQPLFEYNPDWMEATFVSRVALDKGQARIRIDGLGTDRITTVFTALASAGINVDVIAHTHGPDGTVLAFTLAETERINAVHMLRRELAIEPKHGPIAKLSLEGVGIGLQGDVAGVLFEALSYAGISADIVSTSSRVVSVVIRLEQADAAFDAACRAFDFPHDPE